MTDYPILTLSVKIKTLTDSLTKRTRTVTLEREENREKTNTSTKQIIIIFSSFFQFVELQQSFWNSVNNNEVEYHILTSINILFYSSAKNIEFETSKRFVEARI